MPAKNAHQLQVRGQQRSISGAFGKRIWLEDVASDSDLNYQYASDSATEASDLSDDCQDEEDAIESLERFYDVFTGPDKRTNLEERIRNVSGIVLFLVQIECMCAGQVLWPGTLHWQFQAFRASQAATLERVRGSSCLVQS
jgi:hypothetical protein